MANQEHVKLLKQGVAHWNAWREQNQEIKPDLSGADLSDADLSGADLSFVNLSGAHLNGARLLDTDLHLAHLNNANLSGAHLNNASLSGANLSGANLSDAGLGGTELLGANLSSSDLHNTDLHNANLHDVNLHNANLHGSILHWTTIAEVDLRTTKGLAEIQHLGPSVVQLHTVQLPQDGSALHFLRGIGTPDEWIDFWRSTLMHPIQYHSCFISYSSQDVTLAHRLHADLQTQGVRCWFAPEDMKIGDKIRQRIDEAIHLQDKLLLLLSEHSIASTWVENEVEAALEKEDRQQREVLFPIRLDKTVMQTSRAWAATLRRTRHIGDFTNWADPQAYQIAFNRLLRDLKQS
jgi:hypothetical protein